MMKYVKIWALILCSYSSLTLAKYEFDPIKKCDGYPRVNIQTIDTLCVGLVVDESSGIPFVKPRDLLEIDKNILLVTDMGGWKINNGKLWILDISDPKKIKYKALYENLSYPHTILFGPDHKIYLGLADAISRFSYIDGKSSNLEVVVGNLPFSGTYLHPLKSFIFDLDDNLIVNIGAPSDRCADDMKSGVCKDEKQVGLVKYLYDPTRDVWAATPTQFATGLRNSLALAVHSSGTIIQAENGIDFGDAERPYEEINVIENGKFYGWPYCYDNKQLTEGWSFDCTGNGHTSPWTLLPPHVAPLSLLYYQGDRLKPLQGKLIMAWHGYRIAGHRLVAFDVDKYGKPLKSKKSGYWIDPVSAEDAFMYKSFNVSSKDEEISYTTEITTRWNSVEGVRPKGAPSSIKQANDGAIWIVDDKNKAVLRLSNGEAYKDSNTKLDLKSESNDIPKVALDRFFQYCSSCHSEIAIKPESLLNSDGWLRKENGLTILEEKLQGQKMPPNQKLPADVIKDMTNWMHNSNH